jgi:hypothetical protein
VQGYINVSLTAILMVAAIVVLIDSVRRWLGRGKRPETTGSLTEAATV